MSLESEEREQSKLLFKIVPFLRKYTCFAFLGGTVINFFCTNVFRRYSVDLDSVYVPDESLKNVSKETITPLVNKQLTNLRTELLSSENKEELGIVKIDHFKKTRTLQIHINHPFKKNKTLKVKLEVHGHYTTTKKDLVIRKLGKAAQKEFATDCEIQSLSDAQLYSSKFAAFIARNTVKDIFDVFHLLNDGFDIKSHKDEILFNLLGSSNSIPRIFNSNRLPDNYLGEYEKLGSKKFSPDVHVKIRELGKKLFFEALNEKDYYYILASAFGILDQTDYKKKHMPSIINRNKLNQREIHSKKYHLKIKEMYEKFPKKTNRLKDFYNRHISKELQIGIPLNPNRRDM